jgi:hypothetical protein
MWNYVGEKIAGKISMNMPDFHVAFRDLLHAANVRHGTGRLLLPLRRKRAEGFFALKNPTASTLFEPANFGSKGQHPTSRPPKPLIKGLSNVIK